MKHCDAEGCNEVAPIYRQCPMKDCKYEIGYCRPHGGDPEAELHMGQHIADHAPPTATQSTQSNAPA